MITIDGGRHIRDKLNGEYQTVKIIGLTQIGQHEVIPAPDTTNVSCNIAFHVTPSVTLQGKSSVEYKGLENRGISL